MLSQSRAIASLALLVIFIAVLSTAVAAQKAKVSAADAAKSNPPEVLKLQHLYSPYWITEDGWGTSIQLRNNIPDLPLTVTPIVHAVSGEIITLDDITVQGNEVRSIEVDNALTTALSKTGGAISQRYGYLELQYKAFDVHNLFAPVMVHLMGQPVMFHIDPRVEAKEVLNGIYDGFWWNREAELSDAL